MSTWSIRVRLTAWFAAVLGVVLTLIAAAIWVELRESFAHAIDQALADRVVAIGQFLNQPGSQESFEELRDDLREYVALDPGWNLIRITDAAGHLLYCSPALESRTLPEVTAAEPGRPPLYHDVTLRGRPLRLVAARIDVRGQPHLVQVAVPMTVLDDALAGFRRSTLLLIPIGMLAAALGGYWISRRALGPVGRITATARAITAAQLSRRLDVPPTGDELQRLSETLNEMLDRLEAAFRETIRFTADASHELRTPISLIRTSAEVALRRMRSAEEYRSTLETILREAERTSVLVQDLLTLARADAGVDSPQRDTLDLRQLLLDMEPSLRALCARHDLEFRLEGHQEPRLVLGQRAAVARLVLILVNNAVAYTSAPGVVSVSLDRSEEDAVIEVGDTGMGIGAEDLPHVFDRFYRADKARSRDSGGAGLGLSIAKLIVEQHGGRIRIASEPGRGCRVRVDLPSAQGPDGAGRPSGRRARGTAA